ncbi:putative uncharacterized protein DDB_G0282499 isoform X1 [Ostrinia furnacalis]|uniref:putative uncharacterized protein DDB_G0282499 isoform X1 n=2 Tax=Ostrinia furnacalis TaxID=93504 RepID=UPI00103D0DF0|nr:putative uncharacterized protein DDB_G0282499 isoform X1 [Ostrinia furnacalis]
MIPMAWKATKRFPNVPIHSHPQIKSDRINSLRKQYDAFLEEDKKRKERNEYILEKLDKMRYCNAVVPVRQKPTAFSETRAVSFYNPPKQAVESLPSDPYNDQRLLQRPLEVPKQHIDETILQEISKKYILIPKVRPAHDDFATETPSKIEDNTDWKSKYQILEQIKKEEKEQDSPTHHEILQTANNTYEETITKDKEHPVTEYINKIPDNIISENKLSYNLQTYPKDNVIDEQRYYDNNIETLEVSNDNLDNPKNNIETTNPHDTVNDNFVNYENNYEDNVYEQMSINNITDISEKNINNYEYTQKLDESRINSTEEDAVMKMSGENSAKIYPEADSDQTNIPSIPSVPPDADSNEQPKRDNENHQQVYTNQEIYLDREEVAPVQDMNASDFVDEINNVVPESNPNMAADTEYPIETINVQDFTPHDDVQLQDGININPQPQVLVGQDDLTYHYDPVVETENAIDGTKTFGTEQNQDFYNEHGDQNYDYTEEGVADNYNTEQITPNENYEQNEYAYYEGAQTEQPYPEANDNEVTSQRYDQNYEQQYGVAYDQEAYQQQGYAQGLEQTEYAEQMQHYEGQDQTQQDFEKVHYENQDNLTPQYVEQQLDNEQGFTEKQDENIEITNVEKSGDFQQVGDQQVIQ